MHINLKQIVFIILTVFLLKITVADPMRNKTKKNKSQNKPNISKAHKTVMHR